MGNPRWRWEPDDEEIAQIIAECEASAARIKEMTSEIDARYILDGLMAEGNVLFETEDHMFGDEDVLYEPEVDGQLALYTYWAIAWEKAYDYKRQELPLDRSSGGMGL